MRKLKKSEDEENKGYAMDESAKQKLENLG
jgi:hypothetical protein